MAGVLELGRIGGEFASARPFPRARWIAAGRLRDVVPGLPDDILLHAGPPYEARPPRPILVAAAQALVFEGHFTDVAAGLGALAENSGSLRSAQDFGVVTPLLQVVSPSMPMVVVGDETGVVCAPIVEGPPPALRFGSDDPGCITRLRFWTSNVLAALDAHLRRAPVALDGVAATALAKGDECHARTGQANAALVALLEGAVAPSVVEAIAGNPGFVLPLLMAASAWWMRRQACALDAITMAGGNGALFGLRLKGEKRWRTTAGAPPVGPRFPGREACRGLAAVGDSAVVDFCGLGGQAIARAPALREEWKAYLPADAHQLGAKICDAGSGIVSVRRVVACATPPIVNLAILDADGGGLIGRGFYSPPLGLFAPAHDPGDLR